MASATPPILNPMHEFQAGVTAVLRSWSALRAAVEQDWGGHETHTKAEDLRSTIFDNFNGSTKKPMDVHDLEDNLAIYMEEEFSITLEDGSEKEVASVICRMYEECGRGVVGTAREVVEIAKQNEKLGGKKEVVVQSAGEMDEDEDSMMMGEDSMDTTTTGGATAATGANECSMEDGGSSTAVGAEEYAAGALFGGGKPPKKKEEMIITPLSESRPEKPAPVEVDEDGFAMVAPKKGGRRR